MMMRERDAASNFKARRSALLHRKRRVIDAVEIYQFAAGRGTQVEAEVVRRDRAAGSPVMDVDLVSGASAISLEATRNGRHGYCCSKAIESCQFDAFGAEGEAIRILAIDDAAAET